MFRFVSCVYSVLMHGLCLWNPFACKFSTFPSASNPYHDTYTVCHQSDEVRVNLSEWICLVLYDCLCLSVCICVCVRVAETDTCRRRNRREQRRQRVCVCLDSHSYFLIYYFFLCPILSAPLGHPENSSICDFKRPSSLVPLALWGKTSYSLIDLLLFISAS